MYYKKNTQEVLKSLNSSLDGLSKEDVQERLKKYGYNELKEKEKSSRSRVGKRRSRYGICQNLRLKTAFTVSV